MPYCPTLHVLCFGFLIAFSSAAADDVADLQRAGFRGEIEGLKWVAPPADATARRSVPDVDLVAMGRWAQYFLVHSVDPKRDYACRFALDYGCPPAKDLPEDLVAVGDTDCLRDLVFMYMAEMCGAGNTADVAAGLHRRVLSYLGPDNFARCLGAVYCGSPEVNPGKMYISPHTTGIVLVSLAETYARTGDPEAKKRARQVFVALRSLASWDGGRAWCRGGVGPYEDGKFLDTFCTVGPGHMSCTVVPYWQWTGDPEALSLAKAFARGTVDGLQANLGCRRFRPDGSFSDHTWSHVREVWGVAALGAALREPRLIEWSRRVYEYVRSRGTDYGWVPERMILGNDKLWDGHPQPDNRGFPERVHVSETCPASLMMSIAAALAQGGYPEYWDHVERGLRNYIRATQFIMTPKIEAYYRNQWRGKPEKDIEAALTQIRHYQGACGALVPVNGGAPARWMTCGCCSNEGIRAIYTAWKNTVVEDSQGIWINMSFNRESPAVTVKSMLPDVGRLAAIPHKASDFRMRPPSWAPRSQVLARRSGKPVTPVWQDDYILFAKATPNEELEISYPLPEFVQKVNVGGQLETQRPYQVRWRGNTCLGVEPRAAEFSFFEDVPAVLPEPPKD